LLFIIWVDWNNEGFGGGREGVFYLVFDPVVEGERGEVLVLVAHFRLIFTKEEKDEKKKRKKRKEEKKKDEKKEIKKSKRDF